MCGRYTLTDPGEELIRHFNLPELPTGYRPRYNIAPTQSVTAIINGDDSDSRRAGELRWGLVPGWAKDPAIGNRMINARGETVAEKPSFRNAFRRRRCLLPADGFYEWQQADGRKQPMRIVRHDGAVFAFAGLWESWRPPEGDEVIYTCTIITTDANDTLRPIHHRMPVVVPPESYDLWLDREIDDPEVLLPLLRPRPNDEFRAYPVSTLVNNARNDVPECVEPLVE